MAYDPKSLLTKSQSHSRRGFLEKILTGMTLVSAVSLSAFASVEAAQAGADEYSSQDKPKATKAKSRKKAGDAKPAGGSAKPTAGSPQPAGGIGRPESPGY